MTPRNSMASPFIKFFYLLQESGANICSNCGFVVVSNCHLQTANIFTVSHEAKKNIMVPIFFVSYTAILVIIVNKILRFSSNISIYVIISSRGYHFK